MELDRESVTVAPAGAPNAGNIYVTDYQDYVHVFSPANTPISSNINVGNYEPGTMAVSPITGDVYVANDSFQPFVQRIDTGGNVSPIPVDYGTGGVAVAPTGTANAGDIYVTYTQYLNNGVPSVGVINPATNAVTPIPVESPGTGSLGQLAVGPNGDVYVIQSSGSMLYVISDP